MNTISTMKYSNDNMDLLSTYISKPNSEVRITSCDTSVLSFCIINQCWSIRFPPNDFKIGNTSGSKPDLINALLCLGYCLSIFIWAVFSVLEMSFVSRSKMLIWIALKVSFLCVPTLSICLSVWFGLLWTWNFNFLSSYPKSIGQVKLKCVLWSLIRYPAYFLEGMCLVSKVHIWFVSIHGMKFYVLYSGINFSIF